MGDPEGREQDHMVAVVQVVIMESNEDVLSKIMRQWLEPVA
jgi:hypothetical protein